jgi:hypothetical protein
LALLSHKSEGEFGEIKDLRRQNVDFWPEQEETGMGATAAEAASGPPVRLGAANAKSEGRN